MATGSVFAFAGLILFCLGLFNAFARRHLMRRIMAVNVMGTGVFLFLIAVAYERTGRSDPVPHAMVLTGIVVAISATALALAMATRITQLTGKARLRERRR